MRPIVLLNLDGRLRLDEMTQVDKFLTHCEVQVEGQEVLVSLFMTAADKKASFDSVLARCERAYSDDWQYQHPDIRATFRHPKNADTIGMIYGSFGAKPSPSGTHHRLIETDQITVEIGSQRARQLRAKYVEYKERASWADDESHTAEDAICAMIILEPLLEKGAVTLDEAKEAAMAKIGRVPDRLFPRWNVIVDYAATGGKYVFGGTGLP